MGGTRKRLGQFFTPPEVAQTLVQWIVRDPKQRLLDPSCGDGEFLACHRRSVGIELDREHTSTARTRAPWALIHEGDFFQWASRTAERFDVAAGNPPFIRYQNFTGETRERAIAEAAKLGAHFNGLSSSWAPFLVVTARMLQPGGAMAFVVPSEIGHATYAETLIETLCARFDRVHVVAFREKLFPELSEDCWFLVCTGFGGKTQALLLSTADHFALSDAPPAPTCSVSLLSWRRAGCRLRKFLLSAKTIELYDGLLAAKGIYRFSQIARVGIGYVSGANDFFHLSPTEAQFWGIPRNLLRVAVRKSEQLPERAVDKQKVQQWLANDERVLLLHLLGVDPLPEPVREYLNTDAGRLAKDTFKCRNRRPWYVVPDVKVPDAFLSYMSGLSPNLVANEARCVCTNSLHAVRLKPGFDITAVQRGWDTPLSKLSCEIEGHPLGGGMLKLEPGEAANVLVPMADVPLAKRDVEIINGAIIQARRWRHYAWVSTAAIPAPRIGSGAIHQCSRNTGPAPH